MTDIRAASAANWQLVGIGGEFAAAGLTVSVHESLELAVAAAVASSHAIVNEAVDRCKFIVKAVADPCAVELKRYPNGPWRVHAAPWCATYGWTVVESADDVAAKGTAAFVVHQPEASAAATATDATGTAAAAAAAATAAAAAAAAAAGERTPALERAKSRAFAGGWTVINEATARGKCIVRKVDCTPSPLQLGKFPGGPWRVHRAPISVVVGLGCSVSTVQEPRIETCMRVMVETGISSLIWVGSQAEYRAGLPGQLARYSGMLARAPLRTRWRQDVDTRSVTTKGNARFCMERLRDNYCYEGAAVRIILVTSDFHMERARLIFHRAAEAILQPAGHSWYIECRSSETPDSAIGQRYRRDAERLEVWQRTRLWEGGVSDEDVRRWL